MTIVTINARMIYFIGISENIFYLSMKAITYSFKIYVLTKRTTSNYYNYSLDIEKN